MSTIERIIHKFLISLLFSIITWCIVNKCIIEINFFRYLIIEILMLIMLKFSLYLQKILQI